MSQMDYTCDMDHWPDMKVNDARVQLFRNVLKQLHQDIFASSSAAAFRTPVDPVRDMCPAYYHIITCPMDLQTMLEKIDGGRYDADPWLFVHDLKLIVQNAKTFNKGTDSAFLWKKAEKMFYEAAESVDRAFKEMGFCCGSYGEYRVRELACYAHPDNNCLVMRDAKYFVYKGKYSVCYDCFRNRDLMEVGKKNRFLMKLYPRQTGPDEQAILVPRDDFLEQTNDEKQTEEMIPCRQCGRKMHQVCVNYLPPLTGKKGYYNDYDVLLGRREPNAQPAPDFVCKNCDPRSTGKFPSQYTSQDINPNTLSSFIEHELEDMFSKLRGSPDDKGAIKINRVRIRCLSSAQHTFKVKDRMKALYSDTKNFPTEFPYRSKAIFAFQEQDDGSEVVIFGFHVHEYDHTAPEPNRRRVYISYLDSVPFFQPKDLRTMTYHCILLSYKKYARQLGYRSVHIWSCPPSKNDDYIFYSHPKDMKIPKHQRLLDWYQKLLDTGLLNGCIASYTDIHRQAQNDDVKLITQFPYFDSEFWPTQFEEAIDKVIRAETQNLAQSTRNEYERPRYQLSTRRSSQASQSSSRSSQTLAICGASQSSNNSSPRRSSGRVVESVKPIHVQINENIKTQLENHKTVFFVATLIQPDDPSYVDQATGAENPNQPVGNQADAKDDSYMISDPDFDINSEMFDARETFLMFCRTHFLEFSTLRLAKYSTARLVDVVVRDHTENLLNTWNIVKHVLDCVKKLEAKTRGYKCRDPKCSEIRRKMRNKNSNEVYQRMFSPHTGFPYPNYSDIFDIVGKHVILRHNAYCFDPKSCPENLCKHMERIPGKRQELLRKCRNQ